MNIHIVALPFTTKNDSQILPRLAKILADRTGWSLGQKPDPLADLNYYLPYLLHEDASRHTMAAGWFTHREENWPNKTAIWDRVARTLDLRTVSTHKYAKMLERFGDTVIVTPPLDLDKFQPVKRPPSLRPVVGVAGYVYQQSNRKGEALVARLIGDSLARKIELTASGRGWPVPNKLRTWENMEDFYHSLDVLLCTSTIEGPGYTPLEALACGVKVVVPSNVGIFDELPDVPGICRYPRGDFVEMCKALCLALEVRASPDKLRAAVERFTVQAWVEDHQQAFSDLLYPAPPISPDRLTDWRGGNAGVFMVAYGEPARSCAERAIKSWHRHMPGVPVCLASDEPLGPENVFVEHPDTDLGARSVKTKIYDLAPSEWQFIVYVDADTKASADVSFLFDLLADGWEMFICYNPTEYVLGRHMIREDNEAECKETFDLIGTDEFLQANGGVFGFRRCDRTAHFFRNWHNEWLRYGKRDQAAFDRALYAAPLRVYMLGVEWNTITRYYPAERTAGILHYPTLARRWQGIIKARLDEPKAWKEAGLR